MKFNLKYKLLAVLFLLSCPAEIFSWEEYEHRILANLTLDSTLSSCGIIFSDSLIYLPGVGEDIILDKMLWHDESFGGISAIFSGDDISQSRCQRREYSSLPGIYPHGISIIDKVWARVKNSPEDIQSVEVADQNVVFNYLLYHLIALRFAELSGKENFESTEFLRNALIYEAVALSYLSDAFSAGHLLLYFPEFLTLFSSYNNQIAHDFYCTEGVYVLNAQGDCWRTFGDKLMQWYSPSFNRVLEACVKSLREVFLVYFVSNNIEIPQELSKWAKSLDSELSPAELAELWINPHSGDNFYSEIKMPALQCIPLPVAATWSVRTEQVDSYGIHIRKHYSQLSEEKFHDPDLNGIDTEFLYSKSSIPDWMIPEFLPNDTLQNLIRYHPDISSVRYIQDRHIPPSYQGFLLSAGTAVVLSDASNNFGISFGTGYGFADEFIFFIVKPSLNISVTNLFGDINKWILMADIGYGINVDIFGHLYPLFDFGYARGFQSPYNGGAGKLSLGLESETLPLGFTYAGVTFRLKYQSIFFDETIHSIVLEIIF